MVGDEFRTGPGAGEQNALSADQLEAFYHSGFVTDQVRDFLRLLQGNRSDLYASRGTVLDIGGGVGFFAEALMHSARVRVRVVDLDAVSIEQCRQRGVEAVQSDATRIVPQGDESVVCFNLILHHLVGSTARTTRVLQSSALAPWRNQPVKLFVNEYIYESFLPGFSGALIYRVTSSTWLSAVARVVSRLVPALRANTLGVGVRFRSRQEWERLFQEAGFAVESVAPGREERIDLPLRLLLIRSIRRTSFLLTPIK